nr:reverse transcriptase domain-containing protein [Tanacetum cinerariifolium]
MRTRSSTNLPGESSPNLTSSNPKRCNRRRSKQPFILEESPVDMMAEQRIMAELLRAPTEGYAKTIVAPSILVEQFKLMYSLINMMTSDQFFRLEMDNPHDHISKLTHAVNQQTSDVTTAMTAILKQFQATPPSAFVKSVEEICVTCGGAHPGIVLDGPSVPMPPPFINPEEDELVEETLKDQDLADTTSSSPNHLLEEFADELTLITFPPGNDDLLFDIESDLKEIEYLLNHDLIKDIDSILKDSNDESNFADLNDNLVDTMPEVFTDE